MKKISKILCMLLAVSMLLGVSTCAYGEATPADAQWPEFITVLGSAAGGMGTTLPQAIWQVLNEYLPTIGSVQVTAGSTQNMYLMEAGDAWMGFGGGLYCYNAMQGIEGYEKDPITDVELVSLCDFFQTTSCYLYRKGSDVTCFADLNNPNVKVDVGVAGSGAETLVRNICKAFGLLDDKGDYIFDAQFVSLADAAEMIQNNELDAILISSDSTISELVATGKVSIFDLTDEEVKTMAEVNHSAIVTLPQSRFPDAMTKDVTATASRVGFVCRADADEDVVYWIVRTMYEHWDEIGNYNDALKNADFAAICYNPDNLVPYHAGAMRFYKEIGLAE